MYFKYLFQSINNICFWKMGGGDDSYYELQVYQHPLHQHYIDEWMHCYTPSYQHCGPPHKLLCWPGVCLCVAVRDDELCASPDSCVNPVLRWLTVIDGDDRQTPACVLMNQFNLIKWHIWQSLISHFVGVLRWL